MHAHRLVVFLSLLVAATLAEAASTVPLPDWVCTSSDTVFRSGFDAAEMSVPHDPSNGSGGPYPGDQGRVIAVPGIGNRVYYLHLPTAYMPARASPLLVALHGSAGSPGAAPDYARQVRSDWSSGSDSEGFIVVVPVATGATGGWNPDTDIPTIAAALDDTMARYNVERTRIALWGFSSGGHLAHGLALNNTDYFSAYSVSAGLLEAYACTENGSPPPSCSELLSTTQPKIPIDIHLGMFDPLYTDYGAGDDPARFQAGGWIMGQSLFYTLFPGGHIYTIAQLGEIWTNICPFALGP